MTREEAWNRIDAIIARHEIDDEYVTITSFFDYDALRMARKALKQQPKTGHWILSDDGLYRPICDKCGAHPWKGYIPTVEEVTKAFKYCPSCGSYNGGD